MNILFFFKNYKDQYYRGFRNSITINLHDIDLASDYFYIKFLNILKLSPIKNVSQK